MLCGRGPSCLKCAHGSHTRLHARDSCRRCAGRRRRDAADDRAAGSPDGLVGVYLGVGAADADRGRRGAQVLRAPTATLDELEYHVTTLNPGQSPHPPHQHPNEELIIVKEGAVEAYLNGGWTAGLHRLGHFQRVESAAHGPERRQSSCDVLRDQLEPSRPEEAGGRRCRAPRRTARHAGGPEQRAAAAHGRRRRRHAQLDRRQRKRVIAQVRRARRKPMVGAARGGVRN